MKNASKIPVIIIIAAVLQWSYLVIRNIRDVVSSYDGGFNVVMNLHPMTHLYFLLILVAIYLYFDHKRDG